MGSWGRSWAPLEGEKDGIKQQCSDLLQNIDDNGEKGNVDEEEDNMTGVELRSLAEIARPLVRDEGRRGRIEEISHDCTVDAVVVVFRPYLWDLPKNMAPYI